LIWYSEKGVDRVSERSGEGGRKGFQFQGPAPWKWVLNKGHSGLGNTPFERKDPSKQKVQSKRIGFQANAYALKVRLGTTITLICTLLMG